MEASIRSKLERVAERAEELEAMLCDPEVAGDKQRSMSATREHAELRPVAEAFAAYVAAERALAEADELRADPDMRELAEADAAAAKATIEQLGAALQLLLLPRDPSDGRDVVLEIRAGTGGDEASLFAAELWRMYGRFAERRGWTVEPLSARESAVGGLREVIGLVRGREVYAHLKFERGVHRVQRVPATESQGRVHTSTATVAIMPEAEEVDIAIDPKDLRIETMRSGGAGGQHVNTTDSAVRITHVPSGLAVHSQQEKSQHKNREIAMTLLRSRLLDAKVQQAAAERAAHRKEQVGTGERSEKVRTYNFPQDRITDHRITLTRHNISGFMDGDVDDLIAALRADEQARKLASARDDGAAGR